MNAMRGRTLIVALAAVAVVIAIVARGGDGGAKSKTTTTRAPATSTATSDAGPEARVSFVYSTEKEALLKPLVARYNAERHRSGDATVRASTAARVASGEAADDIAAGRLRPTLWSPASSLWGQLLNYSADRLYVARRNPSLVRTPLVIAMWEPMARALGWPRQRVGFADILRLATSPRGWGAVGQPELGRFKLGHTNPDFSTSGLSAVAARVLRRGRQARGAHGSAMSPGPRCAPRIRRIERSIVHYGDTTPFFADQLLRYGPAYASAVAMEEVTLLDFNRRRRHGPSGSSRSIRGRARSTPTTRCIVLDAPWVEKSQGTRRPRRSCAGCGGSVTPAMAAKLGFRPGDPEAKVPRADRPRARRRTRRSRRACSRSRRRRCSTASVARGARTASRPTSCSSSTRRARCPTRGACRRPSAGCTTSSGCCRRPTASG